MITILDAIPINIFIIGVTLLVGVVLFLILVQLPDEQNRKKAGK